MKIIQHHPTFDFAALFGRERIAFDAFDAGDTVLSQLGIGIDSPVAHSFMGRADGTDRVFRALENALSPASQSGPVISAASGIMIYILSAPGAVSVGEMERVSDFISRLPAGCDVVWRTADNTVSSSAADVVALIIAVEKSGCAVI